MSDKPRPVSEWKLPEEEWETEWDDEDHHELLVQAMELLGATDADKLEDPDSLVLVRPDPNSTPVFRTRTGLETGPYKRPAADIKRLVNETRRLIEHRKDDPRRWEVDDDLAKVEALASELAKILKTKPYVRSALTNELTIWLNEPEGPADPDKARRFGRSLNVHVGKLDLRRLSHWIRAIAVLAASARQREIPAERIVKGEARPQLRQFEDPGGQATAATIHDLPLQQQHLVQCLAVFGNYRPGKARPSRNGPFLNFAQVIWALATGQEDQSLRSAAETLFKGLRGKPLDPRYLTALLGLPKDTLPLRKSSK